MPETKMKLSDILKVFDEILTKEEFLEAFRNVTDIVLRVEKDVVQRNNEATTEINRLFGELEKSIKASADSDVSKATKELRSLIDRSLRDQNAGMDLIRDKVRGLRNGKDADENKIIDKVIRRLPKVKELELDTAEKTRNKLEGLVGNERIDKSAIRGLEEALKDLRVGTGVTIFGGGVSKIAIDRHIIDPYAPTGDINGTNTDFVLTKDPNPTGSLKVWRGGAKQQLNPTGTSDGDYSLSGRTITFNIAPRDGEIIEVEHRI